MKLFNLEAEQSVLGAILLEPECFFVGNEVNLCTNDFYHPQHQTIYAHMKHLIDTNQAIDITTLSHSLDIKNDLEKSGGINYMLDLASVVPTTDNVIYYMQIVKDLAIKRTLSSMFSQTTNNIKAMDKKELLSFSDEIKTTLLDNTTVNDLIVDASTISLKSQNLETIKTGFNKLDTSIGGGLNFGSLTVLTGSPGTGKSTFLNQIIANALSQSFNTFLYSGELTCQMCMEWFSKTVANPKHLIMCNDNFGKHTKITEEGFELIKNWINNRFFLYSKDAKPDENNITHVIEYLAAKKNVKLFVLDNLMTLDFSGTDKYEKQILIVKTLKNLAKKYDLVIILVAHSNKSSYMNRESHVFEISGASEIPNLADYVLKASRDNEKPVTYILVLKNRISGSINQKISLTFSKERKRFFTKDEFELQKDFGYEASYEQGSFI